jgi:hypothetical protein
MSDTRHDGYTYARFWYYTPNKSLDDPSNEYHKSDLTITTFNFSYKSEEKNIEANITHVLRHNQCLSYLDDDGSAPVFRHKCLGGYSNGRIYLDRKITDKKSSSFGNWVKSSYNLDNNRSKSHFEGIRSTSRISNAVSNSLIPQTNWDWK